MTLLRTLAAGAILLAVTNVPALSQTCQLRQAASIDIEFAPNGGVLVPVTIAGQPEKMLLQLSDAHSALTQDTVSQLKLASSPVPRSLSIQYMQQHVAFTATAKDFSLGGIKGDVETYVVGSLHSYDPNVAGVLSLDVLENFDVELDLNARKLNLYAADHCPGKVVYWTHGPVAALPMAIEKLGNFTVPMTLDGQAIRASFTTSRLFSLMDIGDAQQKFGVTETSPGVGAPQKLENGLTVRPYKFQSLTGDGVTVSNPSVMLVLDDPSSALCKPHQDHPDAPRSGSLFIAHCYGAESALDLGLDLQRRLHLFFDFSLDSP